MPVDFQYVRDWIIPSHPDIVKVKDSSNNIIWEKGLYSDEPLAFNRISTSNNLRVQLWNTDTVSHKFYYKFEGQSEWSETEDIGSNSIVNIYFNSYNKLYLKHKGTLSVNPNPSAGTGHMIIGSSNGTTYLTGNILSLVCDTNGNYTTLTSIPEYAFYYTGFDGVVSAEYVYFPSFVSAHCYEQMFYNNPNLVKAPRSLPATSLTSAFSCYKNMFSICPLLNTTPTLPATTLTTYCYDSMFDGCLSLTTAPDLPATVLVVGCYNNMFKNCTSLNYIKCYATTIPPNGSTTNWVNNVASTGNFYNLGNAPFTTGVDGIPSGWTVHTT